MTRILSLFLSFLAGLFTVWRVGRSRYYDEERLIDLAVLSLLVGVLVWWVTGVIWDLRVGRVGSAIAVWIVFALFYLRWLRWSWWPTLGFLGLGASVGNLLLALFVFFGVANFHTLDSGFYFSLSILTFLLAYYIVVLGGDAWVARWKNNLKKKLAGWSSSWERLRRKKEG